MASLNSCNFIGNVTRDPEGKTLPNSTFVCDFGMAVNHNYTTQSGEKREECTFLDLTAFARTGEIIAEYAKKGKSIYVECRAKLETWEDKNGGGKRSKIKFIVNNVQLLGGGEGKFDATKKPAGNDDPQDDIPY